jgi:hypothetical protein
VASDCTYYVPWLLTLGRRPSLVQLYCVPVPYTYSEYYNIQSFKPLVTAPLFLQPCSKFFVNHKDNNNNNIIIIIIIYLTAIGLSPGGSGTELNTTLFLVYDMSHIQIMA